MAGRPHRGERVTRPAVRMVDGGEDRAGGAEDGGPAGVVHYRVEKQGAAASRADGRETVDVGAGVHGKQRVDRAGEGLAHLDAGLRAGAIEQHAKASGRLGMVGAGVVAEAVGMGEDGNGHLGSLSEGGRSGGRARRSGGRAVGRSVEPEHSGSALTRAATDHPTA